MRRTGKTTLLKKLIEDAEIGQKIFIDLERIDNRELFSEKNYENIVQVFKQQGIKFDQNLLIGIDEIQLVPNLPSVVKYLYDTYDIKFILTGSSSYYLKNRFNESLAGRKKIFEVFPLTFKELLDFKGVPFVYDDHFTKRRYLEAEYERLKLLYDEYIEFGGFPEVVLTDQVDDKQDYLRDILSSYINLDLLALSDIQKSNESYQLIKLLASRVGTRLDISKLCSLSGMKRSKVENYLSLFEESYLIRMLPVTSTNPDRELVKARKLYFVDNGIASIAASLSSGSKFENAVFNQLSHWGKLAYYSLKSGKEIDFILEGPYALETKETARLEDWKKVADLAKRISINQAWVVGRNPVNTFENYIWGALIG